MYGYLLPGMGDSTQLVTKHGPHHGNVVGPRLAVSQGSTQVAPARGLFSFMEVNDGESE